jgi:hypothetical protein
MLDDVMDKAVIITNDTKSPIPGDERKSVHRMGLRRTSRLKQ